MEYCEDGDLEKLLKAQGGGGLLLKEEDLMVKFVQLCLALQHVLAKVRSRGQQWQQLCAAVSPGRWAVCFASALH